MSNQSKYRIKLLEKTGMIVIPLTVFIYVLRGLAILSWMSGGVIVFLGMMSFITIIIYGIEKTRI